MTGHSWPLPDNGSRQRVQQTVSSIVTEYLVDVQPALATVVAATTGANTEWYVHGPRGIHAMEDSSSAWHWMLNDGLGNVRQQMDNAFAVEASQHYAPYGEAFDANGSFDAPFGFTGEQVDQNDLVYLRARYLNPALGVFASLDPVEGMIARTMSLNGYSWVEGNVVNLTDASGEDICYCICDGLEGLAYINCIRKCRGGSSGTGSTTGTQCFNYDAHSAAGYAITWANANSLASANNAKYCYYPDSDCGGGSDCTNFVSQALREGKFPMEWPNGSTMPPDPYADLTTDLGKEHWACVDDSNGRCVDTVMEVKAHLPRSDCLDQNKGQNRSL